MFDKILIASDGSKTADMAIDMGIDLARKYDCDVAALYIIDPAKTTFVLGDEYSRTIIILMRYTKIKSQLGIGFLFLLPILPIHNLRYYYLKRLSISTF